MPTLFGQTEVIRDELVGVTEDGGDDGGFCQGGQQLQGERERRITTVFIATPARKNITLPAVSHIV